MKKPICEKCKSIDVSLSANAIWDIDKQSWVIGDVFDGDGWCSDCESETDFIWVTIRMKGVISSKP